MSAELSVSFESETIELAQRAADLDGIPLNKWLDRTTRRAARLAEARAALEAHFAEYGEPTEEQNARVLAALEAAGVGRPIPLEDARSGEEALAYLDQLAKAAEV